MVFRISRCFQGLKQKPPQTLPAIIMTTVNPISVKFYEFLNGDIDKGILENWVYSNKKLEKELPKDFYIDLISFAFKMGDLKSYISKLVELFFDWQEYEVWRTCKLLREILDDKIEIVLATRKLKQIYLDQEKTLKCPLISIQLGIGFESVLDNCPLEPEYQNWNKEDLKKQLEPVEWYKERIHQTALHELSELLNTELKSIDMGQIVDNKHMHDLFAEKLRFPDFYGQNWDALWDSITTLVKMPTKLILYNWVKFEDTFPQDAQMLKKIVSDYNIQISETEIEIKAGNNTYNL